MATTIPFKQSSLDSAQKQLDTLDAKIAASPLTFSNEAPSKSDISTDIQRQTLQKTIDTLTSQREKEKWYPVGTDDVTTQGKPKQGLFGRILGALSAPLKWEVGAIDAATGGGEGRGIIENANYNMNTGGQTYGDIMKERGVPGWIASPLGFMADVAGDPVNVAAMGSSSLVGKVGVGAVKAGMKEGILGGLEAAGKGAVTSIGGDALGLVKAIPFKIGKTLTETDAVKSIAKGVEGMSKSYDALTGIDNIARASSNIMGTPYAENAFTLGKGIQEAINAIPGGEKVLKIFKYSPQEWFRQTKAMDGFAKVMSKEGINSSIPIDMNRVGEMVNNTLNEDFVNRKILNTYDQLNLKINQVIKDSEYIAENGTKGSFMVADDATELEARLAQEALSNEDLRNAVQQFSQLNKERTGIDWFDNTSKFIKDNVSKFSIGKVEVGKNMLQAMTISDDIFKAAKVTLNPASRPFAYVGNTIFTTIYGFDPMRVYLANDGAGLRKSIDFLKGKNPANYALENLMWRLENTSSDFAEFVANNPNAIKNTLGLTAADIVGKSFADELVKTGKVMGMGDIAQSDAALVKQLLAISDEMKTSLTEKVGLENLAKTGNKGEGPVQTIARSLRDKNEKATESSLGRVYKNIKSQGTFGEATKGASYLENEVSDIGIKKFYEIKNGWAKKAAEGGPGSNFYKVLDTVITQTMDRAASGFNMVDQSNKLNLSVYMTKTGMTESELIAVAKNVRGGINDADIVSTTFDNGQKVYKLRWGKATEIADDVYMNYAAMPAFVRMMKASALVGMPFASFTYGTAAKVGKNFLNNPQVFNKVGFAVHEMSGHKSPVEKAALDTPYYAWYDTDTMMRLPFMLDNPWYLNLSSWIPYFSMNMFNPAQRQYTDSMLGGMASTIDQLGFFKTPVGQIFWDYVVGPYLAVGDSAPQNQWGSSLYPLKATGLEKAGYAARSLAESYVPTGLAPLGIAAGMALPSGAQKYIPLNTGRKFFGAVKGTNEQGILKVGRTPWDLLAETTAGYMGLPIKPLIMSTLTNTVKRAAKK